jgi:thiamine-phosphate pyrophosphorylase
MNKLISTNLTEHAQKLNLAAREKFGFSPNEILPPVILMTDEKRVANPEVAIGHLPPGAAVIYRHYDIPDRDGLARRLRFVAAECEVLFLVAGDPELARRLEADGCHMPEALAMQLGERPYVFEGFSLLTVAAHSHAALARAHEYGADAALLSPVFATKSHPLKETLGATTANALARTAQLPVYALGGISEDTIATLEPGGFAGIAAIEALS